MLYHILNDNNMYTYDPDIFLNEEYYSKTYDTSDILDINLFKNNIKWFTSNFDIEDYEMIKEKNDVIDIFKFKKCLSNEEEEWIRDAFFVSSYILYNNIDQ